MFGPMRNPDASGGSFGAGAPGPAPAVRNVLELRPTALKAESISKPQYLALMHELGVSNPLEFGNEIFDVLARGELPQVDNIAPYFCAEHGGSVECCKVWAITKAGVRPAIECRLSFDGANPDLNSLSVVVRSVPGKGQVSLSAAFEESSLNYQGLRPDRWMVFEQLMSALGIQALRPGLLLPEHTVSLPLGGSTCLEFKGVEVAGERLLQDPHLPLRPELAAEVLRADRDEPYVLQARRLGGRIFNGRGFNCTILQSQGGLEDSWKEVQAGGREIGLALISVDGFLLPVSRTATLQTLQQDLEILKQLRSEIQLMGPDASIVAPLGFVAHALTPEETMHALGLLSLSLPGNLVQHLHEVMVEDVRFDPAFIRPGAFTTRSIELRYGHASSLSSDDEFRSAPFFSFTQPGSPTVMLWAGEPDSEGEFAVQGNAPSRELIVYAAWKLDGPRVTTSESIARWGIIKGVNLALGQLSLPDHMTHFFCSEPEGSSSEEQRMNVFTIKMPPAEKSSAPRA